MNLTAIPQLDDVHGMMTYVQYRELIDSLFAQNKTTGDNHSESMILYTRLNIQRMQKWDKITRVNEALATKLKAIQKPLLWLVITEAWCGDAAQSVPVINKMAELNENINLQLVLRDQNLGLMDQYLTDGGRSIPKLIVVDSDTHKELAVWGPRPQPAQEMLYAHKNDPQSDYASFAENLHSWYAKDRTVTIQAEFLSLLDKLLANE